jgi:two-component system cell cycle response regulator DivK
MQTICYEPRTTILVADNDDDNRSLVRAVLALKGFDVLEAIDGEKAFVLAVQKRPALLLIDLKLPLVSGIRVIRKLRELGMKNMPIIATSLNRPTSHRDLALAAGCVAHMEKPYEPDQLDDLLDQFLPGTRASLISVLVH